MGRALMRTLVLVALVGFAVASATFLIDRFAGPAPSLDSTTTTVPAGTLARVPAVRFVQLGPSTGITFAHTNGAYGDKLLPETMGGGVAAFDYDNDDDLDLLLTGTTDAGPITQDL